MLSPVFIGTHTGIGNRDEGRVDAVARLLLGSGLFRLHDHGLDCMVPEIMLAISSIIRQRRTVDTSSCSSRRFCFSNVVYVERLDT